MPRRRRFETKIESPRNGVLTREDQPPEYLALKTSGLCAWQSQKTVEIVLLKGTCKISYSSILHAETGVWKKSGSDLLMDPKDPPGEAVDNWDSSRNMDFGGSHFGSSFCHEDAGDGK